MLTGTVVVRFIFINIVLVFITLFFGGVTGAIIRFFDEDITRWESLVYGVLSLVIIDWLYTSQKQVIKWSFGDWG